jgi:hypothetical protein
MALWIPKLEWNDVEVIGDLTITSPTISNIASTAEINVGMIAQGTGIPTGAAVISKTATSVTLNIAVTTSASSATVDFFERFEFQYPPVKDSEEIIQPRNVVSVSLSGVTQVQTNHVEVLRNTEHWFVKQADADKLKNNFFEFALYGNKFRYYPDKDETPFNDWILKEYRFDRDRQVKKHPNFLYKLDLKFTRVKI